mgnify:CR=1 FL=1
MYIIETTKTKATGIHTGDNTHSQDHVITPQSFKTINTSPKSPTKPIPADLPPLFDELFELLNVPTPFISIFLTIIIISRLNLFVNTI